jgi:hypothetical protein
MCRRRVLLPMKLELPKAGAASHPWATGIAGAVHCPASRAAGFLSGVRAAVRHWRRDLRPPLDAARPVKGGRIEPERENSAARESGGAIAGNGA